MVHRSRSGFLIPSMCPRVGRAGTQNHLCLWFFLHSGSALVSRAVLQTRFLEGRDQLRLEKLSLSSTLGRRRRLGDKVFPQPYTPQLVFWALLGPLSLHGHNFLYCVSKQAWCLAVSLYFLLASSTQANVLGGSLHFLMKHSKSAAGFALCGPSWPSGEDKGGRPWSSGPTLTFLLCCVFAGAL